MYKKVSLFLLIVLLVIASFVGTVCFCYNMLMNNEKVEDASLYTNIIEGWDNTLGSKKEALKPEYYIEPIGQMMFATDANDNYMYAFADGERFYKFGTNNYAKDKDNNYIYASAGDSTYTYLYYATSSDTNYDYMYADYKGSQYYTFKSFDEHVKYLNNEKGQKLVYNDEELNNTKEVNFNKDARVYYIVILVAGGIGLLVLISLLIVFITGKIKDKKIKA